MNAPATLAELHRLLDDDQALPPETATGLTSHLPMALQALQALGASAARLQAFRAAHQAHFHGEAGSVLPGIGPDWRAGLGRFDAYVALREWTRRTGEKPEWDQVLYPEEVLAWASQIPEVAQMLRHRY